MLRTIPYQFWMIHWFQFVFITLLLHSISTGGRKTNFNWTDGSRTWLKGQDQYPCCCTRMAAIQINSILTSFLSWFRICPSMSSVMKPLSQFISYGQISSSMWSINSSLFLSRIWDPWRRNEKSVNLLALASLTIFSNRGKNIHFGCPAISQNPDSSFVKPK